MKQEVKTILLFSNILWILLVYISDAYRIIRIEKIEVILSRTTKLILIHSLVTALFIVFLKFSDISRLRMVYFYLIFFCSVFFFRVLFIRLLKYARSQGYNYRNVLIVGVNENGYKIAKILSSDLTYGYRILGFVDSEVPVKMNDEFFFIGKLNQIEEYIVEYKVDEIYVALTVEQVYWMTDLINLCERNLVRLKFIPEFQSYTKSRRVNIDYYDNMPVLRLRNEPLEKPIKRIQKKIFDILFSIFVLVVIGSWLFPILMLLVKLTSKGPIFFKQSRTGEDNNTFTCFKFRTMRVNSLSDELQATAKDPRITKLGAFMRKTNLDELPQFFNVLWGSMSVVGPRPHMLKHTEQYSELISNYLVRHFAKPGITGWAQVNGCRGETKRLEDMQKRVDLDIWYIENWSFLLDVKIIWKTVWNMFVGDEKAR
jgi:putative colanic acid biosynthesis UDP-glucose lipid carrier transferase